MNQMFDIDTAIYPFPTKPAPLTIDEKAFYRQKIKKLLKQRDAVLVAHYYTDSRNSIVGRRYRWLRSGFIGDSTFWQ